MRQEPISGAVQGGTLNEVVRSPRLERFGRIAYTLLAVVIAVLGALLLLQPVPQIPAKGGSTTNSTTLAETKP